ncbi:ceramide glucosyltransferase [Onthophagus taurus]|uniref:ceramide glucosyltransferase n=1 Tax=Onthophagus taurus TaxID=166361 RepID=UPI000C202765|nr:ceramide glucosyltransferase [Onthophagus taurus]
MVPMLYTLYGFAIFFFIYWCAMWLIHLVAIFYGKYRLHQKVVQLDSETPYAGVSIIKPLMGVDPNLFSNLETFFTMTYPKYEILFCLEDDTDPAIMLVRSLMEKYPKVDAKLYLGAGSVGVNPKINNMNKAYDAVSYEFVLISDSGIRMKEDTLQDMMRYMSENTALVHQMPFTSDRDGFAGTLEKIYFGTAQSRIYLAADFININCHTGMSALIRKSVLDEDGGLKTFGCYLAEDFFMAKALKDKGWKMRICSQPALQNSGICDVNSFQARLTRWAKLRVAMLPLIVIMEPLSECMVIGLGAAWAVNVLFKWDVLGFYLIHILMWFICDWILLSIVQNGSLPFNKFDFVVAWLFRECSGPYLFLHAIFDPEIKWRSRIYKLAWGGVAQEIKPRIKF